MEEMKMVRETKKIMGDESIDVTATCVRIPVVYGHSESVYVELKNDYDLEEVKTLLENAPGIVLVDDPAGQRYPLQRMQLASRKYSLEVFAAIWVPHAAQPVDRIR